MVAGRMGSVEPLNFGLLNSLLFAGKFLFKNAQFEDEKTHSDENNGRK